jgi:hypothetical protein
MEWLLCKSEFMPAIKTHIDFFMGHKNAENQISKRVGHIFREGPGNPRRLTAGASHQTFIMDRQAFAGEKLHRALMINRKQVKPDLERIKALARIKIGHVFLCKETRNTIGIQFAPGDVRVNGIIKISKHYDVFGLFHVAVG